MNHEEWIGKTLGEFVDYLDRHNYSAGYYDINGGIGLNEVIGLCIYDIKFIDKYYNRVIVDITGSNYSYTIKIK